MELQAAIAALQSLKRPCNIEFHTDSQYLQKGITEFIEKWIKNDWQRKGEPIPNADLWQKLWPLVQTHNIEWHWVRGHAGNPLNERVDELARQARLEITPKVEISADVPRLYLRASCKGNPGPGGWGVVLERGEDTEQMSGWEPQTTNNRMELVAAIEGLRLLEPGSTVQIFTMSDYLFQGATKWIHGWRKRDWTKMGGGPISNEDLWKTIDRPIEHYRIHWVSAKGENYKNERALVEAAALAAAAVKSVS
jgi:ribonuclease HI